MHSDIDTLERIELLKNLRIGKFDVLVGINLLREGLDIPECGLVAILDADKEGYLRSQVSLIQTIGRAARNVEGRAILYADFKTDSISKALDETSRRRIRQINFNKLNKITPTSTKRKIEDIIEKEIGSSKKNEESSINSIEDLRKKMIYYAENLNFEKAAEIRDRIKILEKKKSELMGIYKTALITGGAQRIGSSITEHLAKKGLNIAIQFNNSKKNIDTLKKKVEKKV